jgi:hypothetical protein
MNALKKLPVFLQVLLAAILLVVAGLFLLPQGNNAYKPEELPWNSYRDDQGRVYALGLIVGQSTLADAMLRYGNDVEIKLFTDHDLNPTSVEAFFPTIYIGSIKSPLILRLKVSPERMQALMNEAPGVRATPTGNKEVLLSDFQARSLLHNPIEVITLVAGKDLPEQALLKRFGAPQEKRSESDHTERWIYPNKGLTIIVDPEGKEVFEWANFIGG